MRRIGNYTVMVIFMAWVSVYAFGGKTEISWGGYGEIIGSQQIESGVDHNAVLDAQRIILLSALQFSESTSFTAEIEFEHADEIFIEQAYLDHRLHQYATWRSGVLILPVGYINVNHEPMLFPTVNRPMIDKSIIPTTWREIGTGIFGSTMDASIAWEFYIINGLKSYDDAGKFGGSSGLRSGRQKASKSIMSQANYSAALRWLSPVGLDVGLSWYGGKSHSNLYDGLDLDDAAALGKADSSVVGINMFSLTSGGNFGGLRVFGEYAAAAISGTAAYNEFTDKDLGTFLSGFWVFAGYRFDLPFDNSEGLEIFAMAEAMDLHAATSANLEENPAYNSNRYSLGLNYFMTSQVLMKLDLQMTAAESDSEYSKAVNMGLGYAF